ncbi:MAG: hypothetical protein PVJ21_16060 [Anaerolineales bacterium]|jgi:hypothetical protein
MRALTASQLLAVWEQGWTQTPLQRALTLLAAACPDTSSENLAQWSIGRRDANLLKLREWVFGSRLFCIASCPECGEQLELAFDTVDIRTGKNPDRGEVKESLPVSMDDYEIRFRLPNSLDLAALPSDGNLVENRSKLLERCLISAELNGEAVVTSELSDEILEAIATKMLEADPQGDVQLALTCPACSHRWQITFDILSFFWNEINVWAQRVMREIHVLASSYGWREADILALSPWRRQVYLQMAMG